MTFQRLWVLFLLPLPLGWMVWEWKRHIRRAPLLIKTAMMLLGILALSEPVVEVRDQKVAVAALVDTSASVTDADLSHAGSILKQLESARGSNLMQVIPFARSPRAVAPQEAGFGLARTAGPAGRGTNLEAPVREALASCPPE